MKAGKIAEGDIKENAYRICLLQPYSFVQIKLSIISSHSESDSESDIGMRDFGLDPFPYPKLGAAYVGNIF